MRPAPMPGPTAGSSAAVLARASRRVSRGVGATVEANAPRLARIGAALVAVAALATPSFAAAAPAASPSPLAARRIVSLAPSVTEILFAVGAGDRVVAVSSSCDRPAEVARLPRVGTWVAPSVEEILALSPDLVVAVPSPGNRDAVLRLRELGLRVEVVGEATLGDAWDAMLRIGEWTGRDAEARELVERLRHELDEVRASVAGTDPGAPCSWSGTSRSSSRAAGRSWTRSSASPGARTSRRRPAGRGRASRSSRSSGCRRR
ncbi:MAG: helical backbone metal receptor [Alphaproteobacteria bacterium]